MKNLFDTLNDFFDKKDFKVKSRGRRWYKQFHDGFIVFELQYYRFDPEDKCYFVNCGIYFPIFNNGSKNVPSVYDSHVIGRIYDIVGNKDLNDCFRVDINSTERVQFTKLLIESIEETAIPYLQNYCSLTNLLRDLESKDFDYLRAVTGLNPDIIREHLE